MGKGALLDEVVAGPVPCEPDIVSVTAEPGHRVLLEYETGERRRFDVSPYIHGDFYGALNDEDYFSQVQVMAGGMVIGWPNGQDIAPDDLYELSEPVE